MTRTFFCFKNISAIDGGRYHLVNRMARGGLTDSGYMVPWAHPSLHPKRHLDRFSRFLQGSRT